MTVREAIESFRNKLREVSADSTYSNQFLFKTLMEMGNWLIKREISAGRIYQNTSFFQTLKCQDVIEVSPIDKCCPVKTKCKVYRTREKLPELWIDNKGPVMKRVTSVDGSTQFTIISPTLWQAKKNDPYQKMSSEKYVFEADGYWFFPEHNPHKANFIGFYRQDIDQFNGCSDEVGCVRFMDTRLMIPNWVEAEMFSKALEQLLNSKRIVEDTQIDKNPNSRVDGK